jgi:hypothetical protein
MTSLASTPRIASCSCSTVWMPVGATPVANTTTRSGTTFHDNRNSVSSSPDVLGCSVAAESLLVRLTRAYPVDTVRSPTRPNGTTRPTGTASSSTFEKTSPGSKL